MRRVERVLVIVSFVMIAGCGVGRGGGVRGSGKVISESRTVRDFSAVEFLGDGQLLVEQTGSESLNITADDNLLPYLTSEVTGGRLVLREKEHMNLSPTRPVVFKLTVKNLSTLSLTGDGTVDAKGIQSDELTIKVTGDGRVNVDGNADRQDVQLTGDGQYHGENLMSKIGRVHLTGDGRVIVAVADQLDANVLGDGSVEYVGNPALTQHVTGDGSIRKH
jgi:hypothetical protein